MTPRARTPFSSAAKKKESKKNAPPDEAAGHRWAEVAAPHAPRNSAELSDSVALGLVDGLLEAFEARGLKVPEPLQEDVPGQLHVPLDERTGSAAPSPAES